MISFLIYFQIHINVILPINEFLSTKGLMACKISNLTWEGVQIMMTAEPGMTSAGLDETLLMWPVRFPLLSQSDFSVMPKILFLIKISK
jgi:hypothetical protein